ncbi:CRISPR-associated endoribonuclease Cas6, partial [Thermoactinomyces daqus]
MRVEVKFHLAKEILLPYDLSYYISGYIYRCIKQAAPELSEWLHNTGLKYKGRRYKPFVFSRCNFASRVNLDSVMKVKGTLSFQIDSIMPEIVHRFVEGAWANGHLDLFEFKFPLQETCFLPPVSFSETMVYKALSPIVIPIQKNNQIVFSHPLDSRFYDSMRNSLKNWYYLRWQEEFPEGEEIHIQLYRPEKFQLGKAAVLTRFKDKNIKGYLVPLEVEAPVKMQQVIYEAGIGSYGSQGFGMVEALKEHSCN